MLKNKKGDLFKLYGGQDGTAVKIIPHVCNDLGIAGAGFIVPLYNLFPKAKQDYQEYVDFQNKAPIDNALLGETVFTKIPPKVIVANMIAQKGIGRNDKPIRYAALAKCMESVRKTAEMVREKGGKVEIHAPKFGSGLAGGKWELIEELINEIWNELEVTVYEL